MMKRYSLIILLFLLITTSAFAQDTRFSQYTSTPLLINPALTGMGNGYSRANLNYRSQWTTTNSSFNTAAISVDFPIYAENMNWKNGYLSTGLSFFNDNAGSGIIKNNEANLALGAAFFSGRHAKFSLGILGGYTQKSISVESIQWDSQYNGFAYDPSLSSQENFVSSSSGSGDVSAGISYRYNNSRIGLTSDGHGNNVLFETGFAAYHLLEPKFNVLGNATSKTSRRYVGHARFLKSVASPFVIGGSVLYMQQEVYTEITIGFEMRYVLNGNTKYTGFIKDSYLAVQILYRNQDAIIPVLSYKFNNWKISTSYDYNLSKLNSVTGGNGGFEISIQFNDFEGELFNQGNKYTNYRGSAGNF